MKYFQTVAAQKNHEGERVCGDHYRVWRDDQATLALLCDGIGSGTFANLAAVGCSARLLELYRQGTRFRQACAVVASSMHRARRVNIPYAAFSSARVRPDGGFVACMYDAPPPVLIREGSARVLPLRYVAAGLEAVAECRGSLEQGDRLLLMSDGVTQAGLGRKYPYGWGSEGVVRCLNRLLLHFSDTQELLEELCRSCRRLDENRFADDTSVVALECREAQQLVIASGPPASRRLDEQFTAEFMASPGQHVICGSTTTDLIARVLERPVTLLNKSNPGLLNPPEYLVEGMELVSEGALMLNQVYHLLDEPISLLNARSSVERLTALLRAADHITVFHGLSRNDAHDDRLFQQMALLPRRRLIPAMADKLRQQGKTVVIREY